MTLCRPSRSPVEMVESHMKERCSLIKCADARKKKSGLCVRQHEKHHRLCAKHRQSCYQFHTCDPEFILSLGLVKHNKMCEMGKNSNRYISVYLTHYSFYRDVLDTKLSRMVSCFEWYHVSSCYLANSGAKADMLPSAAKRLKVRVATCCCASDLYFSYFLTKTCK